MLFVETQGQCCPMHVCPLGSGTDDVSLQIQHGGDQAQGHGGAFYTLCYVFDPRKCCPRKTKQNNNKKEKVAKTAPKDYTRDHERTGA